MQLEEQRHEDLVHHIVRTWLVENSPEEIEAFIKDYGITRDDLSNEAMALSLCPVHFVDWAICFDDRPEDCSQVRSIYPVFHDT